MDGAQALRSSRSHRREDLPSTLSLLHPHGRGMAPQVCSQTAYELQGGNSDYMVKKSDSCLTEWSDHRQHCQGSSRWMGVPQEETPSPVSPPPRQHRIPCPSVSSLLGVSPRLVPASLEPHSSLWPGVTVSHGRIHGAETTQRPFENLTHILEAAMRPPGLTLCPVTPTLTCKAHCDRC